MPPPDPPDPPDPPELELPEVRGCVDGHGMPYPSMGRCCADDGVPRGSRNAPRS